MLGQIVKVCSHKSRNLLAKAVKLDYKTGNTLVQKPVKLIRKSGKVNIYKHAVFACTKGKMYRTGKLHAKQVGFNHGNDKACSGRSLKFAHTSHGTYSQKR